MESSNLVILALSGIAILYILFKVAQKILKGILVLAVAALAFYFWQGGSIQDLKGQGVNALIDQSSLVDLMRNNCKDDQEEKIKCLCIATPLYEDLQSRLSEEEMRTIDLDKALVNREINISLKNKQKDIRKCIINKKGPEYWNGMKGIWEQIKETGKKVNAPS